jgi:hypothetical protein
MLVTYLRSSSYNNYAYCEMQYFITYVLGHPSDSGKKAELGTIVHKVMEVLSGLKKYQQDKPRVKYLKVNDDAVGAVKFSKDDLYTDDCVEAIADLSFEAYGKNSKHKWKPADRKEVSKVTWLMLRHNNGQFDPRNRDIHHPEPHFDIAIEEDWAKFEYEMPNGEVLEGQLAIKGTIDLVTKISDDTIEVIDWKTGRRLDWATGEEKDYEKLMDDPQLLLYYYAISKLYPDFPNRIMSIFFCKDTKGNIDPQPFSMPFDKDDEARFLEMLRVRFEKIKQNQSPKLLSQNRTHWKCKSLCHFCKNDWPETDQNMCIYIGEHLKKHGMKKTVEECTKEGFNIGYYEAPG